MAIDTAAKRASCLGIGLESLRARPPSGSINASARRAIGLCYAGIAAAAPAEASERTAYWSLHRPAPEWSLHRPEPEWSALVTIRTTDSVYKGQRYVLDFAPEDGETIDITSYELEANISRRAAAGGDSDPLLTLTEGDGITVTSAGAGEFTVTVSSARMLTLGVGRFYMDVWNVADDAEEPLAVVEFTISAVPKW